MKKTVVIVFRKFYHHKKRIFFQIGLCDGVMENIICIFCNRINIIRVGLQPRQIIFQPKTGFSPNIFIKKMLKNLTL